MIPIFSVSSSRPSYVQASQAALHERDALNYNYLETYHQYIHSTATNSMPEQYCCPFHQKQRRKDDACSALSTRKRLEAVREKGRSQVASDITSAADLRRILELDEMIEKPEATMGDMVCSSINLPIISVCVVQSDFMPIV